MRKTRRRGLKAIMRRRQRDVLCDVMLSARQCETWLTLDELAKLTHYPPGKHFRAIAASAEAGVRRVRCGEAAAGSGCGPARRGFRDGVGVPDQARDSQEVSGRALAGQWKATFAATSGLPNRDGIGAEEP
jgi:hypothetical protein